MERRSAGPRGEERARVVVVEPEEAVREVLSGWVDSHEAFGVVGAHETQADAIRAMRRDRPDVIILDIEPLGETGLEIARQLSSRGRPKLILLATNRERAAEAFDLGAVDFVGKPVTEPRFRQALERARQALARVQETIGPGFEVPAPPGEGRWLNRLLVQKAGRSAFFLPVEAIRLLEAEQNYVRIHYDGGTDLVRSSLNELERRLHPASFRRVHRSFIVNLEEVLRIEPRGVSDYQVVMKGGKAIPVGRVYRDHVLSNA